LNQIFELALDMLRNFWFSIQRSMLHDEVFYPNPNTFDPDRYMNTAADGTVNKDPRPIAFGFGRR
jgi:cytochrome P450